MDPSAQPLSPTNSAESLGSVRGPQPMESQTSQSSERSTISTLAAFFTSHKPHLPGPRDQQGRKMSTVDTGRALDQSPGHSHGHNHGHSHTHAHHRPFKLLTKSSSSLLDPQHSTSAPDTAKPRRGGFLKLLKRAQSTPTNDSSVSLASKLVNPVVGNTEEMWKNSDLESEASFARQSSPAASKPAKILRDKLVIQYQFFKKYQINSKISDPIVYAPLRLESAHEFLADFLDNFVEKLASGESKSLDNDSERYSNTTLDLARPSDASSLKTQLTLHPTLSGETSNTDTSNTETSGNTGSIPSPDYSLVQLRQWLMQLWLNLAWKSLVRSHSLLLPSVSRSSPEGSTKRQICFLENQQSSKSSFFEKFHESDNEKTENSGSFAEAEVPSFSWINSWQLLCDEPDSSVNTVFISDYSSVPRVVIDRYDNAMGSNASSSNVISSNDKETQQNLLLPISYLAEHPQFEFLPNYSLFTSTSYFHLPLKDHSQDVFVAYDLCRSLHSGDWVPLLKEIRRVMTRGGHLQLVVQDFDIFPTHKTSKTGSYPLDKIWARIAETAKSNDFELKPTRHILDWLKQVGFKDIKYSLLTLPKTTIPLKGVRKEEQNHQEKQSETKTGSGSAKLQRPSIVTPGTSEESAYSSSDSHRNYSVTSSNSVMSSSTLGESSRKSSTTSESTRSEEQLPKKEAHKLPHQQHKTSFYKDERLNNFTSLVTGLTEFTYLKNFTNLDVVDGVDPEQNTQDLLEYVDYRNYGDGSGKLFYDEGYCMFMNVILRA